MQKLSFTLSIFILVFLLAGCAPDAISPFEEVMALENPADSPEISQSAETMKSETIPNSPPASCPVTVPRDPPFVAPKPYSPDAPFPNEFWYGSEALWTMLPANSTWAGLPHNPEGYTQKVFWWREGYVWKKEPRPDLLVTGERLDAKSSPLVVSEATNAFASDIGSAMLVGVDFPTPGCWKISGRYEDAELSFVIWVVP